MDMSTYIWRYSEIHIVTCNYVLHAFVGAAYGYEYNYLEKILLV